MFLILFETSKNKSKSVYRWNDDPIRSTSGKNRLRLGVGVHLLQNSSRKNEQGYININYSYLCYMTVH